MLVVPHGNGFLVSPWTRSWKTNCLLILLQKASNLHVSLPCVACSLRPRPWWCTESAAGKNLFSRNNKKVGAVGDTGTAYVSQLQVHHETCERPNPLAKFKGVPLWSDHIGRTKLDLYNKGLSAVARKFARGGGHQRHDTFSTCFFWVLF